MQKKLNNMHTEKKVKSELENSFDSYLKINKLLIFTYPLFISSIIVFFIDFNLDFNIIVYFIISVGLFILLLHFSKKSFARNYVQTTELIRKNEISFNDNSLTIKRNEIFESFELKDCRMAIKNEFLFIRSPLKIEKSFVKKLFVVKYEFNEIQKYRDLIISKSRKKSILKELIIISFLCISILFHLWKLNSFALNKFVYNTKIEWQIVEIRKDNIKMDLEKYNLNYFGLKNNFTEDTSALFSNNYYLNYRYEPYLGIRILYYSGISKMETKYITNENIHGIYKFVNRNDSLYLTNTRFRIICTKRK